MRKSIVKVISIVLLVAVLSSSVLVLAACNKSDSKQHGIPFDSTIEEIKETGFGNAMKEIVYEVFENLKVGASYRNDPSDALKGIIALAEQSDVLLKQSGITTQQYIDLRDDLYQNRGRYAQMFISYINNEPMSERYDKEGTKDSAFSLALTFCSILGKDRFSQFIYDLYQYRLEYMIDYYAEKEKQGQTFADKNREKYEKDLSIYNSLDIEEFKKLLCGSLFVLDMFSATFDANDFTLSDSEMAKLVQVPDFNVDFNEIQWNFILQKFGDLIPGYFGYMFDVADNLENGGFLSLSKKLAKRNILDKEYPSVVFTLITHIQAMIDEEMIAQIRKINAMPTYDEDPKIEEKNLEAKQLEQNKLALSIIAKATDEDWMLFENLLDIGIEKSNTTIDAYCKKAADKTGNKSTDYSQVAEGSVPFLKYKEDFMTYDEYLTFMSSPIDSKYEEKMNGIKSGKILIIISSDRAKEALQNATVESVGYIAEGVLGGVSPAFTYGLHNRLKSGHSTTNET